MHVVLARALLVACAAVAFISVPLRGSETAESVRYTVALDDPRTRHFRVTVEFPGSADELLASLPAWTPGSYDIENYARNVRNFTAADGSGRSLDWDKTDPDTWRVRAGDASVVRLSYEVFADSLDLDKSKIYDDFAFFNGTNLFVFEDGRTDRAAELAFELPEGWKVATSLPSAGAPGRFRARDYDELVDAPTFLGNFQLDSFTAGGKPAQLAVYPADGFTAEHRTRIRESIDRILTEQGAIVGATPFESYTVLVLLANAPFFGGLEHANSHFDIMPPAFPEAFDVGLPIFQSLLAHETFHAWNVKRIRPAAMWPYDYDEWQPTELLWFSEGVNDYYADLTNVRAGLYTADQFYGQIENNLSTVEAEPAPIAIEDASLNTWLNPVFGNRYVYYPKGSLVGLLLDLRIRHATRGERSLDDVVRELYSDFYAEGRGFTTADLLRLVEEAGDGEVQDFYRRYVNGREPLPMPETLALAGLKLDRRETTLPTLGVATVPVEGDGIAVAAVTPGSAAAAAGVREGDLLLGVGDVEVGNDPQWGERFREVYARSEGVPLRLRVRRDGQEQALEARVVLAKTASFEVTPDPAASGTAKAVLDGLLRGDASKSRS